jgi:glycerol-3-phosphate O-acyltransferase
VTEKVLQSFKGWVKRPDSSRTLEPLIRPREARRQAPAASHSGDPSQPPVVAVSERLTEQAPRRRRRRLQLAFLRNQLIHIFVEEALIATVFPASAMPCRA